MSGDATPGPRLVGRPRSSRCPDSGRPGDTHRRRPARARRPSPATPTATLACSSWSSRPNSPGRSGQEIGEAFHAPWLLVGIAIPGPPARTGVARWPSRRPGHAEPSTICAPASSGTTRHGRACRRRSGSMSLGSVVVMRAWGSSAMRRTRCPRRAGSSSLKTSSSRSSGGRPSSCRQEIELGQLEGQDGGALLPARREGRQVAPVEAEDQVVAMRPDQSGAVPDLLLGRLAQPPGQRLAWRLPGEWRGVRRVAPP